ncbi:MAG TPA: hypothetical protein VF661_07770 [Actinomycetales bacterium]
MSPTSPDRPPDRDRPDEDVDAAFARIIAGWDDVPAMPDPEPPAAATEPPPAPPTRRPLAGASPAPLAGPRDHELPIEPEQEEGYVPPDPPPLPRGDLASLLPWVAVVAGPLFLVFAGIFWRTASPLWLGAAVLSFIGGFVALVMRLPVHHDDSDDDGAVV